MEFSYIHYSMKKYSILKFNTHAHMNERLNACMGARTRSHTQTHYFK